MPSVLREFVENGGIVIENMAEMATRIPGMPPVRTQTRVLQRGLAPAGSRRLPKHIAQVQTRATLFGDFDQVKSVVAQVVAENEALRASREKEWNDIHEPVEQEKITMQKGIVAIEKIINRAAPMIEPVDVYGRLIDQYSAELILRSAEKLTENLRKPNRSLAGIRQFLQATGWEYPEIKCQIKMIALILGEIPIEIVC